MGDDAALLTEFLDGELSREQHEHVLRRLQNEPELADELARAEAARALLSGLAPAHVPADFARKARRQLRRKRAFRRSWGAAGRFGIEIFALIALVLMFAFWLFLEASSTKGPGDDPSPAPPSQAPSTTPSKH